MWCSDNRPSRFFSFVVSPSAILQTRPPSSPTSHLSPLTLHTSHLSHLSHLPHSSSLLRLPFPHPSAAILPATSSPPLHPRPSRLPLLVPLPPRKLAQPLHRPPPIRCKKVPSHSHKRTKDPVLNPLLFVPVAPSPLYPLDHPLPSTVCSPLCPDDQKLLSSRRSCLLFFQHTVNSRNQTWDRVACAGVCARKEEQGSPV